MDPLISRAIAGYAQTPAPTARRPDPVVGDTKQEAFASFFREVAKQSVAGVKAGESATIQGMQGQLDAQSVVEAIAAAELTVQTVAAVRDRIVEAYQELIRMPI